MTTKNYKHIQEATAEYLSLPIEVITDVSEYNFRQLHHLMKNPTHPLIRLPLFGSFSLSSRRLRLHMEYFLRSCRTSEILYKYNADAVDKFFKFRHKVYALDESLKIPNNSRLRDDVEYPKDRKYAKYES